ncbi:hypothetical protein GCM10009646_81000 [Streptomyces aureus]
MEKTDGSGVSDKPLAREPVATVPGGAPQGSQSPATPGMTRPVTPRLDVAEEFLPPPQHVRRDLRSPRSRTGRTAARTATGFRHGAPETTDGGQS